MDRLWFIWTTKDESYIYFASPTKARCMEELNFRFSRISSNKIGESSYVVDVGNNTLLNIDQFKKLIHTQNEMVQQWLAKGAPVGHWIPKDKNDW